MTQLFYITPAQLADRARLTVRRIRQLCEEADRTGKPFKVIKPGRDWLIERASAEEWLRQRASEQ